MLGGQLARGELGAEGAHGRRGRADELDPGRIAGFGKRGLLREEPVTRVDRVGAAVVSDLDDAIELEIGVGGGGAADVMRLVGVPDVDGAAVRVRVNGRGRDAQLPARAHDADRDLAPIRDQDFGKELFLQPIASSGWFGLTTSPSLT